MNFDNNLNSYDLCDIYDSVLSYDRKNDKATFHFVRGMGSALTSDSW
jgi:hypothetical protein